MPKFSVRGTYEMTFFVDVVRDIEADTEEEAIEYVQDSISAGQAYDQECRWLDSGPRVTRRF